jgi:hypothetical protein
MAKRLTKDEWAQARILWESDTTATDSSIADIYKVSQQAVSKKRLLEGWQKVGALQGVNQRAQLAADKSCIQVVLHNQKADVIDMAVEIRADVLERHRGDWAEHRKYFTIAGIAADFELGKSAKITAEMLKIRQEGERKAYGLDEVQTTDKKESLADAITNLIDKLPN